MPVNFIILFQWINKFRAFLICANLYIRYSDPAKKNHENNSGPFKFL